MLRGIIFDMDGVILDSETVCNRTWTIAANELGLGKGEIAQQRCLGTNAADTAVILKDLYGQDFDSQSFLKRASELFHEIENTEGIPLMPYAKEILEILKPKYRIALASSTRKASIIRLLSAVGVLDYFEEIISGDMVEHSKPNPEIYLLACKSLGLKPEECAAIEDSPNGIKSAFAAGLKPIMIPDKVQPDDELKSMLWKLCYSLKELSINL